MPTVDSLVEWTLNNPPVLLCRYQPPCSRRVKSFLLNNQFYATSPKRFNDPKDTLVEFDESGTTEEWILRLKDLFLREEPGMVESERDRRIQDAIKRGFHKEMARTSSEVLRDSTGIVCMTPKQNCSYMWEHYAQDSSGFCLCFEYSPTDPILGLAIPVQYVTTYPIYRYVDVRVQDVIVELMLTKMDEWKPENEWRIIFMGQPDSVQEYDPNCLKSIVFGWKAKKSFIRKCRDLSRKRDLKIKLLRAVKNKHSKGMHCVELR